MLSNLIKPSLRERKSRELFNSVPIITRATFPNANSGCGAVTGVHPHLLPRQRHLSNLRSQGEMGVGWVIQTRLLVPSH